MEALKERFDEDETYFDHWSWPIFNIPSRKPLFPNGDDPDNPTALE